MTIPNYITIFRLCMLPVFLACLVLYTPDAPRWKWVALGIFMAAGVSDAVDGYIARKFNQRSRLGAALDPAADKLLINLSLVFLAYNRAFETPVPYWFPVLSVGRDLVIIGGFYYLTTHYGPMRVLPRVLGKMHTALVILVILAVLIELPFARELIIASAVLTVLSLFDYLRNGYERIEQQEAPS